MQRITKAFHKYMTEQPPWTMREGLGMSAAMSVGFILFMASYWLMFGELFTTLTPGPRPPMVWMCAAIFLVASIIPRVIPATIATYPRVLTIAFIQGIGVFALMGLAMSTFDTLPFPVSAIGYLIALFTIFFLMRVPYRSKQPQ